MNRALRYARRAVAAIYGGAVLFLFLDLWKVLPESVAKILHLQFVPALLGGMFGILALWVLLTLFFGRIYCSVICPLGIFQDFISRLQRWWLRIVRKRRSLRMKYSKPLTWVRYLFLLAVVPLLWGFVPLRLLDPYSIFGRIATSLLRPSLVEVNNIMAGWLNELGAYGLFAIGRQTVSFAMIITAAVSAVIIIAMVLWRQRLWCNTVCPVGTFMGLFSRFSLFKITIAKESCNSCGACVAECKSRCINPAEGSVDASRCVVCFNCLDRCKKGSLAFTPTWKAKAKPAAIKPVPVVAVDASRRAFLKRSLGIAVGVAAASAVAPVVQAATKRGARSAHAMPPGAITRAMFERKCTACGLCVSKCPSQVLQPAFMENGLSGVMQPYLRFRVESFCEFDCRVCLEVCPTGALQPMPLEEKKLTKVGEARFLRRECIVLTEHQDCGACAEHCPTGAVKMVPFQDGLTTPELDGRYCIGCGGCESICPVAPYAIWVDGFDAQTRALPPTEEKLRVGEIDDFGF